MTWFKVATTDTERLAVLREKYEGALETIKTLTAVIDRLTTHPEPKPDVPAAPAPDMVMPPQVLRAILDRAPNRRSKLYGELRTYASDQLAAGVDVEDVTALILNGTAREEW